MTNRILQHFIPFSIKLDMEEIRTRFVHYWSKSDALEV